MSESRWYFDLLYLLDRTPWDTEITPPEVVEAIEEDGLAPGRALDLGCGTGTNCIYLARRGWRCIGVDFSLLAICRARLRASREGVSARFHRSDVSCMPFLAQPFDFVLDIGCLHSVPRRKRDAYASEVGRLAVPGARYMLYAFLPAEANAAQGLAPNEVRELFEPDFEVFRQEGGEDPNGPDSAWYWMRRHPDSAID